MKTQNFILACALVMFGAASVCGDDTGLQPKAGTIIFAGLSPQFDVLGEGLGNVNIGIDHLLGTSIFSLGAEVGIKTGEHMHMDPNDVMGSDSSLMDMPYRYIGIPAEVRILAHPFLLRQSTDVYAGVGIGYLGFISLDPIERDKLSANGDPWDHDGHSILSAIVGLRHDFAEHVGGFAEYNSAVALTDAVLEGVEGSGAFGILTLGVFFRF